MGKFGIGARVRDDGGDEGVIVEKAKGARLVEYDYEAYGKLWQSKASLTALPCPETSENAYLAGGDTENKWAPKVGDRVRNLSESAYDSFPVGGTGTVVGPIGRGGIWASSDIDGWNGFFLYSEVEPVVAGATTVAEQVFVPFTVGQRIRCDDDRGALGSYTIGNFYTVKEVEGDTRSDLVWTQESSAAMCAHRFSPAPLTIEAGKFYRTRDGRKVGPMKQRRSGLRFHADGEWEFGENQTRQPGCRQLWELDGTVGYKRGSFEDVDDLVAEWVEPAAVAVAEATATPVLDFKVGDEALTRNGTKVKIKTIDESDDYPIVHDRGEGSYHACSADGKSCINDREWDIVSIVSPATPPAKFKVGDRVNWTKSRTSWQGCTITAISESGKWPVDAHHPHNGGGSFDFDEIELADAPTLPIGSTVTFTATGRLSAINDNGHMQVTFPGLPAGRNSFALPADYVALAN